MLNIFLLAELVPPDIEKEIRNLYLSLLELLKHFWKCFPPTSPQQETQAVRMHEALQRFTMAKLKPFEVSRRVLPQSFAVNFILADFLWKNRL